MCTLYFCIINHFWGKYINTKQSTLVHHAMFLSLCFLFVNFFFPFVLGTTCTEFIGKDNCDRLCPNGTCVQVSSGSFTCICGAEFSGRCFHTMSFTSKASLSWKRSKRKTFYPRSACPYRLSSWTYFICHRNHCSSPFKHLRSQRYDGSYTAGKSHE